MTGGPWSRAGGEEGAERERFRREVAGGKALGDAHGLAWQAVMRYGYRTALWHVMVRMVRFCSSPCPLSFSSSSPLLEPAPTSPPP